MNTEINDQKPSVFNDETSNIGAAEIVNNSLENIPTYNYESNNNNNKPKKIIIISAILVVVVAIILFLVVALTKSPEKTQNNQQNQIDNNKTEEIIENEGQSNNNEVENVTENKEQQNDNYTYLQDTKIIKRSLGQTSKFDNGINIKITDSIEYLESDDFYYNPMFIKIEISNDSNKNFYSGLIGYTAYSTYTENPIEFIQEDFDYTNFEIQPMYIVKDEVKTERSGCVLRKTASIDSSKIDENGELYDINYFVLKPREKIIAYLLCYFREEIKGAKIKTIYLFKNSNEFMYFIN